MQPESTISFASFCLDPANACLWCNSRDLPLTPKAFAVLHHLVKHAGRLVTKEQLLTAVWPETVVSDAVLKVCVREIRKALGDDPQRPQFIETVHRRGYRFIATLTAASPGSSSKFQAPTPPPAPTLNPQPSTLNLVGRETELGQLHRWLEKALQGERQVVFVTGEAGIGKTTLIDAFLERVTAAGDLWVARGQCVEYYGTGEAYLPVLEALSNLSRSSKHERLVGLLDRYAPTWLIQMPAYTRSADRQRLQQAILGATPERMLREMAEALEALTTETPLVFVLEDLHWSDHATLDLIATLGRRRLPVRLLLIGTYRPVDVIVNKHPLRAVKHELQVHGQCAELSLELLRTAEVSAYLIMKFPRHRFPAWLAQVIHQRTDGNSLFMVNMVDSLVTQGRIVQVENQWELQGERAEIEVGVPENIRQMIEQQLDRFSAKEQQVLEAASVAGMEFSIEVVATVVEEKAVQIEELCEGLARRGQFLQSSGIGEWPDGTLVARYRFTHTLYHNVLYERVSAARRVRFHRRIGERLEAAYGDRTGESAAELAAHFEKGRDFRRAVQYLQQAAANDVRRYANREAIVYLTRMLRLVERLPDPGEQVRLRLSILQQLGLARRALGDTQGAAEDFAALAEYGRERGQREWEVKALLYSATTLSWVDHERCLAAAEQAVALSRHLTDSDLQVHARAYYGYWHSLLHGWRDEDAQTCAEAVKLARQAEDHALLGLHVGRHLYFQCLQSPYHVTCRTAEEELQAALTAGDGHDYLTCQFFRAWALLHAGQWGELLEVLRDGERMADRNRHVVWEMVFRLKRAWLYEQACNFARARELSAQGLAQALEVKHQYTQLLSLIVLGWAHLGLEEYEQAFRSFNEVTQRPERTLMDWILRMPLHHGLSAYWLAQREFTQARQEAQHLCELAAQPGEHTYLALGQRMLAETALAERNWDQAEAEVSRALATLEGVKAPLAEWRVYATAAHFHNQRHRKVDAGYYWTRSAAVLLRLADSLGDAVGLRQSLLAHPSVQTILRRSRSSA